MWLYSLKFVNLYTRSQQKQIYKTCPKKYQNGRKKTNKKRGDRNSFASHLHRCTVPLSHMPLSVSRNGADRYSNKNKEKTTNSSNKNNHAERSSSTRLSIFFLLLVFVDVTTSPPLNVTNDGTAVRPRSLASSGCEEASTVPNQTSCCLRASLR